MDDQSKITATHYQSSRGALEIASMAYPHIANAIAKMERDGHDQPHVFAALVARRDQLDAERAAAEPITTAQPEASPPPMGHNGGPEMTPYERVKAKIDDLHLEAKNWLDGAEVKSQAEADELGKLLDAVRKVKTEADAERIKEKEPFDEAVKEIQARYNSLIGDTKAVKGTAVRIEEGLKVAITAWLRKVAAEQEARRLEAERIAREAAAKAEEAIAHTHDTTDLEDREAALSDIDKARQAAIDLASVNRERAQAQTGGARAIGLVTTYHPEISDLKTALAHYWKDRPEAFTGTVMQFAREDVRAGKRSIPGITIREEQNAR